MAPYFPKYRGSLIKFVSRRILSKRKRSSSLFHLDTFLWETWSLSPHFFLLFSKDRKKSNWELKTSRWYPKHSRVYDDLRFKESSDQEQWYPLPPSRNKSFEMLRCSIALDEQNLFIPIQNLIQSNPYLIKPIHIFVGKKKKYFMTSQKWCHWLFNLVLKAKAKNPKLHNFSDTKFSILPNL